MGPAHKESQRLTYHINQGLWSRRHSCFASRFTYNHHGAAYSRNLAATRDVVNGVGDEQLTPLVGRCLPIKCSFSMNIEPKSNYRVPQDVKRLVVGVVEVSFDVRKFSLRSCKTYFR
jgi:hypothetical protein